MYTYEAPTGENINTTAKNMIALAKEKKGDVRTLFNNIPLLATEQSVPENIVKDFETKHNEASETQRKSPKGQYEEVNREKEKKEIQDKINCLIGQLPSIDFSKQEKVLDWLCKFQPLSDHTNVKTDASKILKIFEKHGYRPGINVGKNFQEENPDNHARYIVGQSLENLQAVDAIHPVVHKFAKDWKKKFLQK